MIAVPSDVRVWLAVGHTDMRRGMNGLAPHVAAGSGGIGARCRSSWTPVSPCDSLPYDLGRIAPAG